MVNFNISIIGLGCIRELGLGLLYNNYTIIWKECVGTLRFLQLIKEPFKSDIKIIITIIIY